MTISSLSNFLDEIVLSNIEKKYQEIYTYCQSDLFTETEAEAAVEMIKTRYASSSNDVYKSYCFLFLGAVLDSGKSLQPIDDLVGFLMGEVLVFDDFRVKDNGGNYVHYLSHATYLASSLVENDLCTNTQLGEVADVLIGAYLRCESAFVYNEDLVLADFLLKIKPSRAKSKSFIRLLSSTPTNNTDDCSIEVIKNMNKRILWMSMMALNAKYKTYQNADFSEVVNQLIEQNFG